MGNIAKTEILFPTGLDPRIAANEVTGAKLDRLLESIRRVLWAGYHVGGRWVCRVDQRSGHGAMMSDLDHERYMRRGTGAGV